VKTSKGKRVRYKTKLRKPGDVQTTGKLTDEIEEEICKLIHGQMTLTDACQWVGISRAAVWEWRTKGQEDPSSRYGKFEQAVAKALLVAKAYLIRGVATHPDLKGKIFILKNRYPEEFRDRIIQEVSGPDGAPVPVQMNPFQVSIILAEDSNQPTPKFEISPFEPGGNGNGDGRA
jgi:hypothetical protein